MKRLGLSDHASTYEDFHEYYTVTSLLLLDIFLVPLLIPLLAFCGINLRGGLANSNLRSLGFGLWALSFGLLALGFWLWAFSFGLWAFDFAFLTSRFRTAGGTGPQLEPRGHSTGV